MAITISDTEPRVQYTATSSQTAFSVPFEFFTVNDIKVYNGTTLLTYAASPSDETEYSVTGAGVTGGGSITLGGGATLNDIVTIYRDLAISRSTDFPTSGAFQIDSLNTELDKIIAMSQQLERDIKFSPKAAATTSNTYNLTFPNLVADKILSVNSAGTALEFLNTTTDVASVATVVDEIALLGTSACVADMAILGTSAIVADMAILATADVVSDMNVLASADFVSDLNVLATSDIVTDMSILATADIVEDMSILGTAAVVEDMSILGTAAVVTDMSILGTAAIVEDMSILGTADTVTDMSILATSDIVTDMSILATSDIVTDMSILGTASVVEDMSILATSDIVTDMSILATSAIVTDMSILGTAAVVEDMSILGTAAIVEDMAILGTSANVTAMATVSTNISGVTSFADRYRVASSAPGSDNDAGDLYFNTSANTLNYYNGSSWGAITTDTDVKVLVSSNDSTGGYLNGKLVAGTGISFTENNDGSNETLTITNTGEDPTALAIALG